MNANGTDQAAPHGDPTRSPLHQLLENLRQRVAFDLIAVVSTMPRGGLQLVQPQRLPDGFVKGYAREFSLEDRATWQAIFQQKALAGAQVWPEGIDDRYQRAFVRPLGYEHLAVAPLEAPVLKGYAGAVHVYRKADQGEFTQGDLFELTQLAEQIDRLAGEERAQRTNGQADDVAVRRVGSKHFVFDSRGQQLLPQSDLAELDSRLQEQIQQHVQHLLANLDSPANADRVSLPDANGDLWNFRVSVHQRYPALSNGAVVFFNLVPDAAEWATLRPSDFAADPELARMVPAMRFMHDEFARVPTLQEIAKTVHLSPFHFHRRFTELLGLTPKHFLLDCQIAAAKRELVARQKELSAVAASCGFAHQSHFTSRFKQATGLTPTRWRKLATETQDRVENN